MATVKVGESDLNLAPLKSLQVAEFMDDATSGNPQSASSVIRRSLRVVAQSLANGGSPQAEKIDDAIAALNEKIAYTDLDPAFREVMKITGISLEAKSPEGEAPAAESTTGESSAAS